MIVLEFWSVIGSETVLSAVQ